MTITIRPGWRAPLIGVGTAAALIGSFLFGSASSGSAGGGRTAASAAAGGAGRNGIRAVLASAAGRGRITVTGTGTVTGTPSQLVLSMGVRVNGASVSSALRQANRYADRVIASLRRDGVSRADIQTSGLSIQPSYRGSRQVPVGYGVSEQLRATLVTLAKAGTQIQDAVTAGGNAVVVDGVSLNLTDTGGLLRRARAAAVRDAQAKASQFASALHETVQGVISVSDHTTSQPPLPLAAAAPASAAVPVLPGTAQVRVQITIVYAIG